MIHVFNGDAAADAFRKCGLEGDVLVIHEVLASGPAPRVDDESWVALRSRHITSNEPGDEAVVARQLQADLAAVDAIDTTPVVMWAEHDLACQLAAAMVVARLGVPRPAAPVRVVTAGEAQPFRGLAQLSHAEFETALAGAASSEQLASSYAAAWDAYRDPDRAALERAVGAMPPSPLREALALHLRRHPSDDDPLGITDSTILRLLGASECPFPELCRNFFETLPGLGFGDLEVAETLRRLSREDEPLVALRDDAGTMHVRATEAGRRSLDDPSYARGLRRSAHWLGGVQLYAR